MSEEKSKKGLNRRDFIKGAAVGAGAIALSGLGLGAAKAASPPEKWDEEADVVVVGYGGAGAVTAITAHDEGADVLLLEKQPANMHTPNSKMCGGLIHYAIDVADATAYFKAIAFGENLPPGTGDSAGAYPKYPKELVDDIADVWGKGVVQTVDWLQSLGPIELPISMPKPAFPDFPGAGSYGTVSARPRPGGLTFFKHLTDAVEARGINISWETPGKRLVISDEGKIHGVIAERRGKEIAIKARKAVVLTAGGFEYDEGLKKEFLPGWKWAFMGNPDNTGDGVRMAMGAGAFLGHMFHAAARVVAGGIIVDDIGTGFRIPCNQAGMILVDNYGRRYANEDHTAVDPQRYQFYNLAIVYDVSKLEYPRIPSWLIVDDRRIKAGPLASTSYGAHTVGIHEWSEDNSVEIGKGWLLKANTIEQLAQTIAKHPENMGRIDPATLKESIDKYNRYCDQEKDPDFGRTRILTRVEEPPYYAVAMYPGGPNTEGGPIRDAKAQVINVFGEPIPRLYAAGELGSVFSFAYQGGGNVAELIIFGRIAGQNAAAKKSWS